MREAGAVLEALRERNRASAAACHTARMHEALLADCTALEKVALKCERLEQEAEAAKGAEAQANDATRAMGEKLELELSKSADFEEAVRKLTASEASLKAENEALIVRLTEQLQIRAMAMDSEREEHEQRLQVAAADSASGEEPGQPEEPEQSSRLM